MPRFVEHLIDTYAILFEGTLNRYGRWQNGEYPFLGRGCTSSNSTCQFCTTTSRSYFATGRWTNITSTEFANIWRSITDRHATWYTGHTKEVGYSTSVWRDVAVTLYSDMMNSQLFEPRRSARIRSVKKPSPPVDPDEVSVHERFEVDWNTANFSVVFWFILKVYLVP